MVSLPDSQEELFPLPAGEGTCGFPLTYGHGCLSKPMLASWLLQSLATSVPLVHFKTTLAPWWHQLWASLPKLLPLLITHHFPLLPPSLSLSPLLSCVTLCYPGFSSPGHVQAGCFSVCSGVFQMPLDVLSLYAQ